MLGETGSPADGNRFGKYVLHRRLGVGSMAEVFLAEAVGPTGLGKLVALKRLHPHLSGDREFTDFFIGEARLGASLNHPNIVQTIELGQEENSYYLALEYIQGPSLSTLLKHFQKNRNLPLELALDIAIQLCMGLAYAHNATDARGTPLNMIHRDLKPANILLNRFGQVKITDFGVAKSAAAVHQTMALGTVKGTIGYMSPEQAAGEPLDHRSDLYSLGAVLFELVTLEELYLNAVGLPGLYDVMHGNCGKRFSLLEQHPDGLVQILAGLLQTDREERYSSADEVKRDLVELQCQLAEPAMELGDIVSEVLTSPEERPETSEKEKELEPESFRLGLHEALPPPDTDPDAALPEPIPGPGDLDASTSSLLPESLFLSSDFGGTEQQADPAGSGQFGSFGHGSREPLTKIDSKGVNSSSEAHGDDAFPPDEERTYIFTPNRAHMESDNARVQMGAVPEEEPPEGNEFEVSSSMVFQAPPEMKGKSPKAFRRWALAVAATLLLLGVAWLLLK